MTETGYGVYIEDLRYRSDIYERLLQMIKKKPGNVYAAFQERYGSNATAEDMEEYCENYETISSYGLEGLLVDFINEQEHLNKYPVRCSENAIYISADIPEDEESKKEYPTQEGIAGIFSAYLNPLLQFLVDVRHITVYS